MTESRRVRRARTLAAREFFHYHSAYRRAAREADVAPSARWNWLCRYEIRNALERAGRPTTGAGLLAFNGCRAPVDAHDAALRTLAQWTPGTQRPDMLESRAAFVRGMAACGQRAPYLRVGY